MRRISCLLAAVWLLIEATGLAQLQSTGPVQLDSGQVSGGLTGRDSKISVYKGIPYVAPPVGELRWRAPHPVKPWEGVRAATQFGAVQPQQGRTGTPANQSEDSLYLNIWTPAKASAERLPVMVWIHGGGFTYGSGSTATYDGTRLAEHGVVMVSFNYRLNVLSGFAHPRLSKESPQGVSGNYGMLDQVALLQWVQRNIAAFGGDANNVTIFGESAGGLSVCALMVSPLSKGLFHRAIVESGSTNQVGALAAAERDGVQLAAKMEIATDDPDALAKLRAKPWSEIPGAASVRGGPILDGYFLTEQPLKTCAEGKQHPVPLIVGYNRDEATFFNRGPVPKTVDEFKEMVRTQYRANADKLLTLYPATSDSDVYWATMNLRTDAGLGISAPRQARAMQNTPAKAWFYHFSYLAPGGQAETMGVSHAAELSYVFGTLNRNARDAGRAVSDAMMDYWTQFAKTGDPNRAGLANWPSFDQGNEWCLDLGDPIRAVKDFKKEKIEALEAATRR